MMDSLLWGWMTLSPLISLLVFWSLIWKGIALWKAARNNQMGWYIAMLILQTAGILEIVYILRFQKKRK